MMSEEEMNYWKEIEALGYIVWKINHDLTDGRIKDPDGKIDESIKRNQKRILHLVSEIKEKFGIIPPEEYPKVEWPQRLPPPAKGKIYYWDWYDKIKDIFYKEEYDKLICSACPFSDGVEKFKIGSIPCRIHRGIIYSLMEPYICGMISYNKWSEQRLYKKLFDNYGKKELMIFKKKEKELEEKAKI